MTIKHNFLITNMCLGHFIFDDFSVISVIVNRLLKYHDFLIILINIAQIF